MRVLVTADPIASMQVKYDTSLRLMTELLHRGHKVDFCDLTRADATKNSSDYLDNLPVEKVLEVDVLKNPFIALGTRHPSKITNYDLVLNRKDPPVDDFFIQHAKHLAQAPGHIVQINNPAVTWKYSEHVLPNRYPQFATPTFVCNSLAELTAAVRAQKPEAVLKPENQCSGFGIEFLKPDAGDAVLQAYWDKWQPCVIVQPFLEEITASGDLRILVLNKKVIGSVLRVPKSGSRLANLHQGATGRAFTPTPRQLAAVQHVSEDLNKEGIYLIGLDFIGDYLNEVNITSPSAMVQINEVMHKRAEVEMVTELEALVTERKAP